ncbi:MAG: DUF2079 domain-containing protein [Oscillospiraceae bacterium]|jgi:uncharacterized membrane protein|nr:DUF2079 domain-containing protein [Oscillospiraceae bacterium]
MNDFSLRSQRKSLAVLLRCGGWAALCAAGGFAGLLAVLLRAWLRGLPFTDLEFVAQMPWGLLAGAALGAWLLLAVLCLVWESARPVAWGLLAFYMAFAFVLAVTTDANIYFSLGLCVPLFLIVNWFAKGIPDATPLIKQSRIHDYRLSLAALALLFLLMTAILAYASILRYKTYNATSFDLGLFGQMFASMRRSGHAFTTLERNRLLTHFGVHFSPFYYVLLPFYLLVPRVETLLVLQAAAVSAGLFAVRAIAKQCFGLSPRCIAAACLLYFLHPAFGYGCIYDFHENKFLAPLLLWAFYCVMRGRMAPLLALSVLVLSVKEDAAVYVAVLAIYMLISMRGHAEGKKKTAKTALLLLALSVAWFFAAAAVVRHYGDGVMVSRLRNYFLPEGDAHGFGDVLRVFVSDAGYVLREVFTQEKVEFLLWMLLPLGFAPLLQKRNAAWVLLLPVVAVNLLSNYTFQYSMGFQYAYGTAALALALALVTLGEHSAALRRRLLLFAVCASLLCAAPLFLGRVQTYRDEWQTGAADFRAVDAALAALPPEAEITATTWFTPHMAQREAPLYLYPNFYAPQRVTEYLLCRESDYADAPDMQEFLEENYIFMREVGFLRIYRAIWI